MSNQLYGIIVAQIFIFQIVYVKGGSYCLWNSNSRYL